MKLPSETKAKLSENVVKEGLGEVIDTVMEFIAESIE
jgi:hypothetical protein